MRTVIILLLTAAVAPAADPPKAKLAELVKLYKAYDLPVPPKDAKLYREAFKEGGRGWPPPPPRIGFGLKPDKDGVPTVFLVGCETDKFSVDYTTEIRPESKRIEVNEIDLVIILQFHLQGWTQLADELLPRWKQEELWDRTLEQELASAAWAYWYKRLQDPKVDRALIVRRMASAMRAEPEVFADEYSEMTYVDLRKSLLPSRAKPGTPEALIDEWLDMAEFYSDMPEDERYAAVVRLGFDAVPALIDALTDTRLTRSREHTWMTTLGCEVRIQTLAANLLSNYMGVGLQTADDEEIIPNKAAAAVLERRHMASVKKWWTAVSKANEEEYVVGRVIQTAKDHPLPNTHLLLVIRHKYPKR